MNLLIELKETSSRTMKEVILSRASELEQRVFNYAYDYNKVYHLKQVGLINLANLGEPDENLFTFLDFTMLNPGMTPGQKRDALEEYCKHHGDLAKLIVRKDLDVGATAKTVNKVHPGLIPVFNVQLAKEVPLEEVEFPCIAQVKYDGVRLIIIKHYDNRVEFITRNGKKVNLPVLAAKVANISGNGFVLDCEATLETGKVEDRTQISGKINSAMHGSIINESNIVLNVFDALLLTDFNSQVCYSEYRNRYAYMVALLQTIRDNQLVPATTVECSTKETVQALYEGVIEEGYEGLILKHNEDKYQFKRSKQWIKMKEIKEVDLICYDYHEGEGKYEGMIGALLCEGKVEGKQVKVAVGSGLTDQDRQRDPIEFMAEKLEIKYNTVIQDSTTGEWSLFLPRYVRVRFDK